MRARERERRREIVRVIERGNLITAGAQLRDDPCQERTEVKFLGWNLITVSVFVPPNQVTAGKKQTIFDL